MRNHISIDTVLCGFTQSYEVVSVFANPLVIRSGPKALHGCRQDLLFAKSTRHYGMRTPRFLLLVGSPSAPQTKQTKLQRPHPSMSCLF